MKMRLLSCIAFFALFPPATHAGPPSGSAAPADAAAPQPPVPLPHTTPYDSAPRSRAIYLDQFRIGYLQVLNVTDPPAPLDMPVESAAQDGRSDGLSAAGRLHPGRAARLLGLPVEAYRDLYIDTPDRVAAAKKIRVPDPAITSYDSDPIARHVYLQNYRRAYRAVLSFCVSDCQMFSGPYRQASREGWSDGLRDGFKEHPETITRDPSLSPGSPAPNP